MRVKLRLLQDRATPPPLEDGTSTVTSSSQEQAWGEEDAPTIFIPERTCLALGATSGSPNRNKEIQIMVKSDSALVAQVRSFPPPLPTLNNNNNIYFDVDVDVDVCVLCIALVEARQAIVSRQQEQGQIRAAPPAEFHSRTPPPCQEGFSGVFKKGAKD